MRYAYFPPSRKVKMSVCHIWFGVARSKNRGRVRLRRPFARSLFISPASCNRVRTVSGLPGSQNILRSTWAIRFTPQLGSAFFSSTIRAVTGSGSFFCPRRAPHGLLRRPSSPCSRYALIQFETEPSLAPSSRPITSRLIPSSRFNFTALSRSSYGYTTLTRFFWLFLRGDFFPTSIFSSIITLLYHHWSVTPF